MIEQCPNEIKENVLEYLDQRFGLSRELFTQFAFYLGTRGRIILGPTKIDPSLKVDTLGLLIARLQANIKPSSNLFLTFGTYVVRNMVDLDREDAITYARGYDLKPDPESCRKASDGYVMLRYNGFPLGCGLLKSGHLKNMLPRAKRLELRHL